ncbi:MAG: TraR/DksA family transcriptional regulator [Gammaproteobacteria bacterium]|nr:TraR/DksA family transcriptional regulator [Gammaproteobacteria bacterium]MDE0281874.1 TraR/DksA family transcriptional regulator [Gammaproteobacteria bacterium]MDE0713990.1 TraR/DksA family transcriptional regulator [Gammaproteobacteria bacterium]MXX17704.1 TraR/DksA family transcriptional regulator [Gammaproteobacteria bacterium]MXY64901.1 TraR/DksA family transcriptional regulator [Gammaproteobacteria bacterium]
MKLTDADITAIRDQLLSRRLTLEASATSHRDAVARTGHIERGGVDRGDESNQVVESGIEITQADRAVYELSLVNGALARLENGEFGICVDCGESIGSARLLANPIAKRCLACQSRREEV